MALIAIITISDRGAAGLRDDASGEAISDLAAAAGHAVVRRALLPDERSVISQTLAAWCDEGFAHIIITTGGTGLGPRDITPEATRDVAEREVPGLPVALALEGLKHTPHAVLSRGVAVTRRSTLIVNLPGNPRAVKEGMDVLLPLIPHIEKVISGPLEHGSDVDTGHALFGS